MKTKILQLLGLAFIIVWSQQSYATNYYVSPDGNNNSGNGSLSAPWATIQKACDYVAAGDIIYLRGGIYNQRDYIDANVDGTATNPITIMNYNGEEVIFDGTGVPLGDNAGLIFFANWDSNPIMEFYVLDGITVRNSTERGISFYKTDHLVIKNCLVHDIEKRAIGGFGHYITIENNEIYNAALENEYGAMGNSGWAMTCYTTTDYENGDPSTNVTIRNNYIHNCWGEGIGPGQGSDQVLIEGNTVRDVWSVGIYADKATNATIKNNHIYNTDPTYFRNGAPAVGISMANEISFGNIYNPISNFYIYNNLISNVRKGIGFWFDESNDESGNSYHNLVIAYNVIYQPTAQGIAIDEIPSGYNQPSGCILKNNIVYSGASQSTVGDLSAWDISHNDWVGGIPSFGTSASFNTDPGFVNPGISAAPEGFKLGSANASCYGTGVSIAAFTTEDFWHSARSASTPCIGIHEASFSNAPQYYVDANVSSSGNGLSWASAFKTIQEAADLNLQPGDVVNIKPGTYPEAVNIKSNGAQIVGVTANVSVLQNNKISFPAGTNLSEVDLVNHPGEYYALVYRSWKSNNGYYKITQVNDAGDYVIVENAVFTDETGVTSDLNYLSAAIVRPVIYKKYSSNPETERVVLNCSAVPSAYTILYIGNAINDYDAYPASCNIIDGLDVTNSEGGIHLQGSSFNVLVNGRSYNTTLGTGCLMNGNETRQANYNFLINYKIYDVHSEGVYVGAGGHPQFNNHTHFNHLIDNEIYVSGTTLLIENAIDLKEYNKGNVVEGNYIHDIKLASGGNGIIDIRNEEDNALVYGNVFENILKGLNSTNYIINIYGENNNVSFFNNIIYNTTAAADGVYALRVDGGSNLNCLIANNTFYNIHKGMLLEHYSGTCTTTIANNIIDVNSTTLIEEWGNEAKFTMTHNLYSSNPSQYASEPGRQVGVPNFANPAAGDFHLTDLSALAIDKGVVTSPVIACDIEVVQRSGNPDIGAFESGTSVPQPMVYVSSTCTQNAAILTPGETNQMVIGIQIVTSGNTNPLEVNSFTLNASGTTNLADISNAKLFYTGNAGTFNTNNQFGSAVPVLTFSDFTIIGSQTLSEYVNYFWLCFDIAAGASIGNLADASCVDISLGTQTYIPTITSPAGATQIGQIAGMEYVDSYGVQISDDVNVGTINAPILQMPVITSGVANPLLVSQIRINVLGTTNLADIANARIFYTGNNPEFSDAVQFGTTKANPLTTNFIIAGSQSLLEGTNYFWLSLDVLPGATVGNVIDGQYRKIWIDGTAIDPGSKVPAGNRTIVDDTPAPDMELASVGLAQITGLVFPGSVNNEILQILLETSGTGNPLEVNSIDFSAVGSTSSTDIGNAKVFFTGSTPVFSTASQFGAGKAIVDFNVVNLSGSQILEEGLNYFWLSFDINENAPGARLIDAECYSVEIGGNIYEINIYNPEGSREVLIPLLENTVQFGFGTKASYKFGPMYRSRADSDYDYSRFSYLYTQAELSDGGVVPGSLITKIAWYKTNTANITNNGLAYFDIYMKNSDKTILVNPTNWETGVLDGATLVAEKTYTKTDDPFAVNGWMEIELDQPFVYAGGALEISTDWDISGVTNYPTNGGFNWQWTDVAAGRTIAAAHDYPGGVTDLVYREPYNYYYGDADGSKRPNIQITYSGSSVKGKEISNNVQTPETNISNGDARIYSQNSAVVIEFSELPEKELMVYLFNLNGQIIKSLPLESLKMLIPLNNTHGLVIVKIQGTSFRQIKKVMLE
ncbi:MAG: right-handed parallel beta-helix repeat-containing protein [Bacteroidales bacterium]|nr:right-handed parallel beta-helix repeat-containing protein [Bacteroidales bacterium]